MDQCHDFEHLIHVSKPLNSILGIKVKNKILPVVKKSFKFQGEQLILQFQSDLG